MASRARSPSQYARVTGSPGERARFAGLVRLLWPLLALGMAAGYLARAALPSPPLGRTVVGLLFLLLGVLGTVWAAWGAGRLAAYVKGARGEEAVARELAFLPAAYRVFHGLGRARWRPGGPGDVDHVVVGPNGVFVIETKHWSGRIAVRDGRVLCEDREPDRPPLDQAREAASRLRAGLRAELGRAPTVRPLLCFVEGALEGGTQGAGGVVVCRAAELNDVILHATEEPLPEADQARIAAFLAGPLADGAG
jgi:hypothetical protein